MWMTLDDGSRRPSSRRSGRVMVAPSDPWGTAGSVPASQGSMEVVSRSAAASARRRSRSRAGLGAIERQTGPGDDRPAVEAGVHEHQADARLGIAREDGGGDRAGAAMSGQQGGMQIQGASGRHGQDRRWHELAVVGEHEQVGRQPSDGLDGLGRRRRSGVRVGSPRISARRCTGVGVRVPPRPTGRAGAVTTVTTSTEGASTSASKVGTAKAPLPKKTARRRTVTRAVSPAPRPRRRRPAEIGRPR